MRLSESPAGGLRRLTMFTIKFVPSDREVRSAPGRSLLDSAREAGIHIESPCNGMGKCGKCKVRVVEGRLNPFTEEEVPFIHETERRHGTRLACRAKVETDVTIFVPQEYLLAQEASKKVFSGRVEHPRPAVNAYTLGLDESGRTEADLSHAVVSRLGSDFGLKGIRADSRAFSPSLTRGGGRQPALRVSVWMDSEVIRVAPASDDKMLGLAVDIGTTTVALYLCDLASGEVLGSGSFTNPQIIFGADVVARIAYSAHNPRAGVKRMREALLGSINGMVEVLTREVGSSPSHVLDMTVVGNTVMHHIFLGIKPDSLGLHPFLPAVVTPMDVKAANLGVAINSASYVHMLPVEAGFVGADNVAVIISEGPHMRDEPTLVIDIGTNGEIVLGNRERLFSCSCATGPALEGAGVSHGMRAVTGAIERVRVDPGTLEVDYRVIGSEAWTKSHTGPPVMPRGICGSAIIDAVAQLFAAGVIDRKGAFAANLDAARLRRDEQGQPEFVLAWPGETGETWAITISQRDIRQVQLAKAALRAGCEVLMKHYGVDAAPRIVLAGAFGMHIDVQSALTIGLLPPSSPECVIAVGNAAGHGAYLALMDREKRKEAARVARSVAYVELASDKAFREAFLQALSLP